MNPQPADTAGAIARRLPAKDKLEYVKIALELALLLLAVPWLLREIIRNPKGASRRAARKHLG